MQSVDGNKIDLSLIMPAYNEQEGITAVLSETKADLENTGLKWEIIVIDNCSNDQTVQRVTELASADSRIKLLRHDHNKLYSGSCRTGIAASGGEYVAIMDSDGQFVARDLPKMIQLLKNGSNLVFGWRRHRNDSIFRKFMSWFFNMMGRFWLGFPLHDLNSGIRIFDRKVVRILKIEHAINMVNPEIFAQVHAASLKVAEVEVEHFERRGGKTSHDLMKIGKILIQVNRYMATLRQVHLSGAKVKGAATETI